MNMKMNNTGALIIVLILFRKGVSEIVSKPKDTEAVVGTLVYFNCSSSITSAIHWFFYGESAGQQGRSIIYGYNKVYTPFDERFRVESNETSAAHNLIIDSVTVADAGKYECQEDVGRGAKSSAELIILESEPLCQSDIDTSEVTGMTTRRLNLSCSVNFYGNAAPKLQWNKVGDASFNGTERLEIIGNLVIYNVSVKVKPSDNNAYYTCNTTRSLSKKNGCGTKPSSETSSITSTSVSNNFIPYWIAIVCLSLLIIGLIAAIVILLKRNKQIKEKSVSNEENKNLLKEKSARNQESIILLKAQRNEINVQKHQVLEEEINELEISNGDFKVEFKTMKSEIAKLKEENKEMKNQNAQLKVENEHLKQTLSQKEMDTPSEPKEVPVEPCGMSEVAELQDVIQRRGTTINELRKEFKPKDAKINELQATSNQELREITVKNESKSAEDIKTKDENEKENTDKGREAITGPQERTQEENVRIKAPPTTVKKQSEKTKSSEKIGQNFDSNPNSKFHLLHTILPEDVRFTNYDTGSNTDGAPINGIAVLDNEIYVIFETSPDIKTYNPESFTYMRKFSPPNIHNPVDIASIKANRILCVINGSTKGEKITIFRILPDGRVLNSWPAKGSGGRLSVYEENVILCLEKELVIHEYDRFGDIVTEVSLSPSAGFSHPWHAIKVSNIHFVVSDGDQNVHRVCVVDTEGNVIKVCQTWEKTNVPTSVGVRVPMCLLQDKCRNVVVADHNRILLLSSDLNFKEKLIDEKDGLKDFPTRLCFDDNKKRILVVTNNRGRSGWKNGRVLIFRWRQ